jgi:hypothetical protein
VCLQSLLWVRKASGWMFATPSPKLVQVLSETRHFWMFGD